MTPADCARIGAAFALATGLAEAAVIGAAAARGRGPVLGPDATWMAPIADLAWFGVPALLMAAWAWRRPLRERTAVLVLAFLSGFALLNLPMKLYPSATAVLAAGIALQVARGAERRPGRLPALCRRALPALAAATVLLCGGTLGVRYLRERSAYGSLTPARQGAPNVVLLVLDTVRGMETNLAGSAAPTTPNLLRWASRGVRFGRAISPSSWTLPAHASMFTGHLPGALSAGWTSPLNADFATIAEVMANHGYRTGAFVANQPYGRARMGLGRGFVRYVAFGTGVGEFVISSAIGRWASTAPVLRRLTGYHDILGRLSAADVNGMFLTWYRRQEGRPVFTFLNYYDAHVPYLPPRQFAARFPSKGHRRLDLLRHLPHDVDPYRMFDSLGADGAARERAAYDAAIAYMDEQVDQLLRALDADGGLEHTVVIITADHGEQFLEHGLFDHGNSMYRELIEVPLVVIGAGATPGAVIDSVVSLRDLAATVADLAGIGRPALPGASLARYWAGHTAPTGEGAVSEAVSYVDNAPQASVVSGRFHYVRAGEVERLYDWADDAREERDLAAQPERAALLARLRATLDSATARRSR